MLSARQVQPLLDARAHGDEAVATSLDLGLSHSRVVVHGEGVVFPDGATLNWARVEEIARAGSACFVIEGGEARKIHAFSPTTERAYSLMATDGAPTLLNSGFAMHRIVDVDPYQDTLNKIRAASPIRGTVLDTTTGLGYTAIEAAKRAERVVTIELDPTVLDIARLNPWSRELFDNPGIEQRVGDAFEEVASLQDGSFSLVIHDPPSFSLAGELYSGEFYRQVFRILRRGGRFFHYIGNPASSHAARVTRGVVRRLKEAGFARVEDKPEAFAVVAVKGR